jgi:peptidoglycan/LPS O-acetylase OafA/YrhL
MKKNIFLIIGIIVLIVGVVVSYFGGFAMADDAGFAMTMFGAGLIASQLWDGRDKSKPTWLSVVSIACIAVGAFLLGFLHFDKESMGTIISTVFGLAAIIGGLIIGFFQTKQLKK